jgi:hypothetical protein
MAIGAVHAGAALQRAVSKEKLSARQWQRLEAELRRGPLAWGYAEDQCWTLGRVKTLIGRLFRIGYTIEGCGASCCIVMAGRCRCRSGGRWSGMRRLLRHGKAAVWPAVKAPRRTWAPDGARPVVTVHGRGSGQVTMAGVVAYRDGERPRLSYKLLNYHGRKGEPKPSPGPTTGT